MHVAKDSPKLRSDAPYPPFELAHRVCSLEGAGDPYDAYEHLGAEAKGALLGLLPTDWSFDGKRALDFGCGAGRTLRHFLEEAKVGEIWGTDIDADSIAWLDEHLCPPLHVRRNDADPPLPFDDESFDLIWALSVFTHLTDNSLPWLAELHRVLRPGGLLIASYMGRLNGYAFTQEAWDEDLVGMNVLRRDQEWEDGGPMVLMSDWWVQAHWGRAFEIVRSSPVHGQTWALLQKRDAEITVSELAELSDDPREIAALRHNIAQVERDRVRSIMEVRNDYEHSLSWRVTRPLRTGRAALRRAIADAEARGWSPRPRRDPSS
jgi:SAM-dependent methyltransferase